MKTAVYSIHNFEKEYLINANAGKHDLLFIESRLSEATTALADGCEAISIFTSDKATSSVLQALHGKGIKHIALRTAGFNNVDLQKAKELKMNVARVPAYSPFAIAEHTVAMMLALNRKLIKAHNRVRELNFSLDGLVGFDMNGKTVGIIGTGKIGAIVARILHGFGCRLLAFDKCENEEIKQKYQVEYTDCMSLCRQSDIITLHVPLNEQTKYIINQNCIECMKRDVMLINTGRGGLVNTNDVIQALKKGRIKYVGMDVYEEEEGLFFEDHSEEILQDDTIARLMTFQNVLITSHQGFLTETALKNISDTTIYNLDCFEKGIACKNEITI